MPGLWASDDEPIVTVRREPRGTNVAWSERPMRYVCRPARVGTPPPPTTISVPEGVRALSTATIRDQPPDATAVTSTTGEPNTSRGARSTGTGSR